MSLEKINKIIEDDDDEDEDDDDDDDDVVRLWLSGNKHLVTYFINSQNDLSFTGIKSEITTIPVFGYAAALVCVSLSNAPIFLKP